jgi:hypothetical protein
MTAPFQGLKFQISNLKSQISNLKSQISNPKRFAGGKAISIPERQATGSAVWSIRISDFEFVSDLPAGRQVSDLGFRIFISLPGR